jgi:cytochrome c-type biogenesis protein CcmH/NrfG
VTAASARWDPDRLAALEYERDVLDREAGEVDTQLERGEIDVDQHRALRYVLDARAADVVQRLDAGRVQRPDRRRSRRATAVTAGAVAAGCALLVWMLTTQLAPRTQPTTRTTATADSTVEARAARLAAVVERQPDDAPSRVAYARVLLEQQDLPHALEQYDAAARIEPGDAEALAYGGWIAVLSGDSDGGRARLDRAVATDASYPDAHALRGLALLRAGERADAAGELRRYLELAPNGPLAAQVAAVVDRLGSGP